MTAFMKARAIRMGLAWVAWTGFGLPAMAQGVFVFGNAVPPKGRPVVGCDAKPVSGPGYRVDLAAHNPATGNWDGALEVSGADGKWTKLEPVRLKEGNLAGLFHAGTVRVPFVAPGQEAKLRVRAWLATDGVDFDRATVRAETNMVVVLGGVGDLPSLPTRLRNFPTIKLCP